MNSIYTIMVVDDIEYSRSLVEAILLSAGYKVVLADGGKEALERLSSQIDLLIIDAIMPEMSGFQLATAIRKEHKYEGVPILMATGLADRKDFVRAYEAGVDGMITKPFDRITLQMHVRGLIRQRQAHLRATECQQHFKRLWEKLQEEQLSPEFRLLLEQIQQQKRDV